ncbi:MAG: hypothetical protein OXU77_16280 [Gammaproteobacteria bacterium]|nr:hypothetical protein [Gammaproteobacteria bacterium]
MDRTQSYANDRDDTVKFPFFVVTQPHYLALALVQMPAFVGNTMANVPTRNAVSRLAILDPQNRELLVDRILDG